MTGDYQTAQRMALKEKALPPIELKGLRVLDVGCDHGYWCFKAHDQGARFVLGLDRGREVRGQGFIDLPQKLKKDHPLSNLDFQTINLGKQWRWYSTFDVIFVMSVYHHIFENVGDHLPIWYWLRMHCHKETKVIFEGPTSTKDPVVQANVSLDNQKRFTISHISEAAEKYFDLHYVGPALHAPYREVIMCSPKPMVPKIRAGITSVGMGGAHKAFLYADSRRAREIQNGLGFVPFPGSLNIRMIEDFDWDENYLRLQVLDVVHRRKGLDSDWAPRWCRFYPMNYNAFDKDVYAMRFEGETYSDTFIELISSTRLRNFEHKGVDRLYSRTV